MAGTAAAAAAFGYYATLDVQKKFELASASGPLLRSLDAETAHRVGILAAKWGLFPRETRPDPESLRVQLWGRTFPNPIGMVTVLAAQEQQQAAALCSSMLRRPAAAAVAVAVYPVQS